VWQAFTTDSSLFLASGLAAFGGPMEPHLPSPALTPAWRGAEGPEWGLQGGRATETKVLVVTSGMGL
jgi:hypothetical protein